MKYRLEYLAITIVMWLAWHLPRRLVYWSTVRAISHAAVVLPRTELDAITPSDVLKAWKVPQ